MSKAASSEQFKVFPEVLAACADLENMVVAGSQADEGKESQRQLECMATINEYTKKLRTQIAQGQPLGASVDQLLVTVKKLCGWVERAEKRKSSRNLARKTAFWRRSYFIIIIVIIITAIFAALIFDVVNIVLMVREPEPRKWW